MLRVLVIAAVLANGAFYAWTQGWFAPVWPSPRAAEHEPARLKAQVRPEAVTMIGPGGAASAGEP